MLADQIRFVWPKGHPEQKYRARIRYRSDDGLFETLEYIDGPQDGLVFTIRRHDPDNLRAGAVVA